MPTAETEINLVTIMFVLPGKKPDSAKGLNAIGVHGCIQLGSERKRPAKVKTVKVRVVEIDRAKLEIDKIVAREDGNLPTTGNHPLTRDNLPRDKPIMSMLN